MNSALSRTILRLHEKVTGRQILSRLDELNRTQWFSLDELLHLQREKLQHVVDYANRYVPYYQRAFHQIGFSPEDLRKDPACFTKLPVLTKSVIRENYHDLITTEPERRGKMSLLFTSGSTGEPLGFMQDSDYRDYVTADIQRHMGWAGWQLGDCQAVIWGASHNPKPQAKFRANLIDWTWNRIQLNSFIMTDQTMLNFAGKIKRHNPRILFGYATSINQFAQFLRKMAIGITFDAVFSTAEVLVPPVREFIEETFRCAVLNRYGTLELGGIACECKAHTGLHISMESNYVEILRGMEPVNHGETGDIIVTNLNNHGMPFIRYNIGDAGSWVNGGPCPCGRQSPMLNNVDGRLTEMFKTRDGRQVRAAFSGGFRCLNHPTITKFQAIQKSLDLIVMRLVPSGTIPETVISEITHAIQTTFGENVSVNYEILEDIPLMPSGKHQYAISELH